MAYKKILVDNITCSRRFHVTYDDSDTKMPRVELRCPHCQAIILTESNHPAVTLARDENLVKTANLSEHLVSTCHFEDQFSKKTQPQPCASATPETSIKEC